MQFSNGRQSQNLDCSTPNPYANSYLTLVSQKRNQRYSKIPCNIAWYRRSRWNSSSTDAKPQLPTTYWFPYMWYLLFRDFLTNNNPSEDDHEGLNNWGVGLGRIREITGIWKFAFPVEGYCRVCRKTGQELWWFRNSKKLLFGLDYTYFPTIRHNVWGLQVPFIPRRQIRNISLRSNWYSFH